MNREEVNAMENTIASYMKKEEFIEAIKNIDFIAIKTAEVKMIKGFLLTQDEDEKIKPVTINFEIY